MNNDIIASVLGPWSLEINTFSILFRLGLTVLLTAIIGWERSGKRLALGLRTFIILGVSACGAMIVDISLMTTSVIDIPILSAVALISAFMTGNGATYFSSRSKMRGITTVASLCCSTMISVFCGAGFYFLAIVSFICLYVSTTFLAKLEKFLLDRSDRFSVHMELRARTDLKDFVMVVRQLGMRVREIESNPAYHNSGLSVYSVSLSIVSPELRHFKTHAEIIEALSSLEYVSFIEEQR